MQIPRHSFLAGVAAGGAFTVLKPSTVFSAEANSRISLGLIGCGGRGSWIARLFQDSGKFKLAACADYFQDRVDAVGNACPVEPNRRYTGLSGYKRLLESQVDAVVIETPPYFHPEQAAADGSIAPGASAGTLSIAGNLGISALANGGTGKLVYELGPVAASDKIAITGTLTIGAGVLGLSDFVFSNVGGMEAGTYKLITSGAPISGTLDSANLSGSMSGFKLLLQINGNDLELVVVRPTIPPGALSFVGGVPQITLTNTLAGLQYRLLYNSNLVLPVKLAPEGSWAPVMPMGTEGWYSVKQSGDPLQWDDVEGWDPFTEPMPPIRFYMLEVR